MGTCCCCCPQYYCTVTLDILKKGEIYMAKTAKEQEIETKKNRGWFTKMFKGGHDEGDISEFDTRDTEDFQYDPESDIDRYTQKRMSKMRVKPIKKQISMVFAWDIKMTETYGKLLHQYVYGSVNAAGVTNDAHSLAQLMSQGIC